MRTVDNYILERKIGGGQYAEVFKGKNKLNNMDCAVKVLKRQVIKGKFMELLEAEIRVLQKCTNENIIKLFDIKKTVNNYYLILEYCNEGDMLKYMKARQRCTEDEAIPYLLQLFNAFKTLEANNIMHRDVKLANVLRHDGKLKLADFGFCKLFDQGEVFTSTMLGSPLNMAPEILNGENYTSTADVWSVGTVFYEILFGRPPWTAQNRPDLLRRIRETPLVFPKNIKISPETEDLLRKMLVVPQRQAPYFFAQNHRRRIKWSQVFQHPINDFLKRKERELEATLVAGDELQINASQMYIRNNQAINHIEEIKQKEPLNSRAVSAALPAIHNSKQSDFTTQSMEQQNRRADQRSQQYIPEYEQNEIMPTECNTEDIEMPKQETQWERQIRIKKENANRILHERNLCALFALLADESIQNADVPLSEIIGFLLLKMLLYRSSQLTELLQKKQNIFELEYWQEFTESRDYSAILSYMERELKLFQEYFNAMYDRIQSKVGQILQRYPQLANVITADYTTPHTETLEYMLREYSWQLMNYINQNASRGQDRQLLTLLDRVLDCRRLKSVFQAVDPVTGQQFDFKLYYQQNENIELPILLQKVQDKFRTTEKQRS